MKIERTKNAAKNIATGIFLKLFQTLAPFLMRTAMIHLMGVEYLGLNGLFISILHILNLAELGVGAAMVFSMYRPIAKDDPDTICALMRLYRRYYRIIGLGIGTAGLILTPVIPRLISGDVPPGIDIYVLYLLNLASTVLTYWLFAYKNCLLQAHQKTNISNMIQVAVSALQYSVQLAVLVLWKNYYLYVLVNLGSQALVNVTTAVAVTRMYPQYKPRGELPREQSRQINGRIRDLFTGKLGSVVLNSVDTVVISAFLGLAVLAVYQNYYFILTSIIGIVEIIFGSVMGGLGNSFVTETREKNFQDLKKFTFLLLWLSGVCACCFLGMYQPFMKIWVGEELMLEMAAVVYFALYFYVYIFNRLLSVFKDAAGLWHEDRMRPLVSAMINLGLNLLWVKRWGINGVLLSTVVSMAFVGMPWMLRNLFALFFSREQLMGYLMQVFSLAAAATAAGVLVVVFCSWVRLGPWTSLAACVGISVAVPNVVFYLVFRRSSQFGPAVELVDRLTGKRLKLCQRLLRER